MMRRLYRAALVALCFASAYAMAQTVVSGRVDGVPAKHSKGSPAAVVWLSPLGRRMPLTPKADARLTQKDKSFDPHVLVIPAGTKVEFPNRDPFFHNVFSLFEGKRFDLGLYEAGSSRSVLFDKPGISYVFCNIHPEMGAVVIAVDSPYFATLNASGAVRMEGVEPGAYRVKVWAEGLTNEQLKSLTRDIVVGDSPVAFGTVQLPPGAAEPHTNKYGRKYDTERKDPYDKP